MPTAVQVTKTGGPEVLEPAEVDVAAPKAANCWWTSPRPG